MNSEKESNMFEELQVEESDWMCLHFKQASGKDLSESFQSLVEEAEILSNLDFSQYSKDNENSTLAMQSSEQELSSLVPKVGREKLGSLKKKNIDYQKNICAYITKRCVMEFVSPKNKDRVKKYCLKHKFNYQDSLSYYKSKLDEVFGVGLLGELLIPASQEEFGMKAAFHHFTIWYLRNRYVLYLNKNGKMEDKEIYMEYKNKYILYVDTISGKSL